IAGFLRDLGFEVQGALVGGPGAPGGSPAPSSEPFHFQFILSNHPLFHPFLSADYGNLMDIKIYKYYRLQSSQALPLIFAANGDGLLFQAAKSQGKLFVVPFSLDREHTSWPVHQTFIPFLDLALQNARAEDPTPTTFEPGEIAQVQIPPSSPAREV